MTITHERCRHALAEGHPYDDAVVDHAATCSQCAGFAQALDRLDTVLEGSPWNTPPGDLASRVVETVARADGRAAGPFGRRLGGSRTGRSVRRSFLITAVATAAVVMLVLATVISGDGDSGRNPAQLALISAARDLEAGGPAHVDVEAQAEFAARVGDDGQPRYAEVPPEVRPYLEDEWARLIADFERNAAELEGRIDTMLTESERRMNEMLGRTLGTAAGADTPPREAPTDTEDSQREPRREPQRQGAPPAKASVGLRIVAGGGVDFRTKGAFEGEVAPVSGTVEAPATNARFAVAVDGNTRAVRGPDGVWSRVGGNVGGPLDDVLLDAGLLPRLLRSAGDVEELAPTTAADGSRLRRYRFAAGNQDQGQRWRVEVALGVDGRVHVATLAPSSVTGSTLAVRMVVGARGVVDRETAQAQAAAGVAATTGPGDGGSRGVTPIGPAVRAAFEAGSR